jgi:hypothetical protein
MDGNVDSGAAMSPVNPFPASAVLNAEAADAIERYVPNVEATGCDAALWVVVGPVVRDWITRCCPSSHRVVYDHMLAFTRLALYGYVEIGTLEIRDLFIPDQIRFLVDVTHNSLTYGARKQLRFRLIRAGRLLNPGAWPVNPEPIPRTDVKDPYTAAEEQAFRTAAEFMSPATRLSSIAIVALGFGAGLDGRWTKFVRGTHIVTEPDGLWVRLVADGDRLVPVRDRYVDDLTDIAEQTGDGLVLGGERVHRNRASWTTDRIVVDGIGKLNSARMRSTWFVALMNAGVDVRAIQEYAGFTTLRTLQEVLRFVDPPDHTVEVVKVRRA